MKKVLLKMIAFLVAILTLTTAIVSCKNNNNKKPEVTTDGSENEQTTEPEETETKSAAENTGLELRDFNKASLNIWYSTVSGWAPQPLSVSAEEGSSGDVLSQAGYARNDALETDLNLYIEYTPSATNANGTGENGDVTVLRNLANGGDLAKYDIIMTGLTPSGTLAKEGILFNLLQSDYITPEAYYYESQVNEQMKFFDHSYFAVGYYSIGNTKTLATDMVNIDILESATDTTIKDLYELALDNKWTIELLMTLGRNYATVMENTGDPYTDHYSWITSVNACYMLYQQLGGKMIDYNESTGLYEVAVNKTQNIELLTWIQNNIGDQFGREVANLSDTDFSPAFIAGSGMFYSGTFSSLDKIMSSGIDFAALPPALLNEGDEYRSYAPAWNLNVAGIPAQCRDIDKATYLYEMFMAYSYDYVYPAYYQKLFRRQYQTNELGVQIFDLTASCRVVDMADVLNLGGKNEIRKVIRGQLEVASTVTSVADSLKTNLDAFVNEVIK